MRRLVSLLTVAPCLLVVGVPAWAEDDPRFAPMQQFEIKSSSPPPVVDRTANSYARCAGWYLDAVRQDAGNDQARNAVAVMMKEALSVGADAEKEALYSIRDEASEAKRQARLESEAVLQKLAGMDEAQQATLFEEHQEELMAPLHAGLVHGVQCAILLRDLERTREGQ